MQGRGREQRLLIAGLVAACVSVACDEPNAHRAAASAAPTAAASAVFDQAAVDRVIEAHQTELSSACGEALEAATVKRVALMLEIDAGGRVLDAAAAGGGLADRPLRECVERELRKWTFPAPGTPQTVSAVLDLKP